MPSDVIEPGAFSGATDANAAKKSADNAFDHEQPIPPGSVASSTSGDDLSVILTHATPDPLLGEFDQPLPSASDDPIVHHSNHERRDALNALSSLELSATDMVKIPAGAGISPSSTEALASINFGEPSPAARHPQKSVAGRQGSKQVDEEDESEPRGIALSTLLLASYASAVTLGLIWVLWTGRRFRDPVDVEPVPSVDARPDPGRRSQNARHVVPPLPIAAEHLTTLGKPVRLGEIEATPLAVTLGPVVLMRDFNKEQKKIADQNALKLRLRLKNLSSEIVLAPLDEDYLRSRPRTDPESYIETAREGSTIGLYPLALQSEWSIVGQVFKELRPGESFESLVVSTPEVVDKLTSEMTWRIRLRTNINHTDDLGVRFLRENVVAEPQPKPARSDKR